ncbi:amidohydrolase [Pseudoroseomonas wenyumeiae]|uniref:Amidohydrolase n=1 Tax=Teichococcus wenyumeiae TaxID=2478470 RepID=A0A3A9JNA1_9PROT|nr:amidohydrolase [Pseudoroseomonas wenyumeiae]RKK05985.1 amidohydrolase [Pseudoroseomonas wenyumeiae]RMI19792.1 amidohydrolase [Pseudoroseomonas wenyumeiae]
MTAPTRRTVAGGLAALSLALSSRSPAMAADAAPDMILHNGRITTLDRAHPAPEAVAVTAGRFSAVGEAATLLPTAGPGTRVIDLGGRRLIPGLIDNHLHVIRGGLNYNMELRWDGVRSLADAMDMLRKQVAITPPPQWVRIIGGFTEHQFAEKRLPTLDEINAAAPDTPVFILHLYDRALLNAAALRVVGYDKNTPNPPGGEIQRAPDGTPTGLLLAKPNATILYATLAKGPVLPLDYQLNSTRHFLRDLNRLGVTGAIDAGGGYQNYPDDYEVIQKLAADGELTVRIAYNLFTQKPKQEKDDFLRWTSNAKYQQGDDYFRLNGAGEMLVFSAADFEDFRMERPELPPEMELELEAVVRILVQNRWPWRLHATYDQTISRALDVFEKVDREMPIGDLHWIFDHAETVSDRSLERIARLGGGVAVQHRMAYQGEYFVERYGARAAEATPPVAKMLEMGVKVSAGTDATRVASYNPWVALSWLTTGRTVGGMRITPERNRLDRETALRMLTEKVTWFSNEEGKKGQIAVGQLADMAVLDRDYFGVPEDEIQDITSVLTILGGRVVHGAGDYASLAPPLPPAMPDWSPVRRFGGYQDRRASATGTRNALARLARCCDSACGVHGHEHARAWAASTPAGQDQGFWGALGCSCWAF